MQDVEAKKYCLVFLKGKGLVEGWFLLAKKLRTLGVSTPGMSKFFLVIPTLKRLGVVSKRK